MADPDNDRGGKQQQQQQRQEKRPEVEHYKPGAFRQRTGSEEGRKPRSADSSVTRVNTGGRGGGRGGRGGGRKKPDLEPYVPKKAQEQRDENEINFY